jgi:diaminohydroxyphosphoribosylaminopyrimidine deaminase/5-amino-6-(5-phosphoribosylamino)uracil reductase
MAGIMSHEKFMNRCLELARNGKGKVSPNPLVGSVIVKNGEIVSEGWHHKHGDIHAEIDALRNLPDGFDFEGATLYCNLEPCSYDSPSKINKPCAPQIIDSGIKNVVISMIDPNPEVAGDGIKMMREAGLSVEVGINEPESLELNRIFTTSITKKRPFIALKIAQTLDGFNATDSGDSKWITNEKARAEVHSMRSNFDAVLVGADTVLIDNPQLNVRFVEGRNPFRIVIDSQLRTNLHSTIFSDDERDKTIVCTSFEADQEKKNILKEKGVQIVECSVENEHLNLKNIFKKLHIEFGITSIFIEGGQSLNTYLLKNQFIDEIIFMIAPKILGNGRSVFGNFDIDKMEDAIEFAETKVKHIDNNIIIQGKVKQCLLDS